MGADCLGGNWPWIGFANCLGLADCLGLGRRVGNWPGGLVLLIVWALQDIDSGK